jgi:hypothetical protein
LERSADRRPGPTPAYGGQSGFTTARQSVGQQDEPGGDRDVLRLCRCRHSGREIGAHNAKRYAAVAAFETIKPLMLLNLAELPDVPSVFDSERRSMYYT